MVRFPVQDYRFLDSFLTAAAVESEEVRFASDSPLEEAVTSEPVSAHSFPGNRVKYRELHRSRPNWHPIASKTGVLSEACEEIP
jgi:hypothetical protein